MKKLLFLTSMILCSFVVQAQLNFLQTASNPTGAILNTSVDTMNLFASKGYSIVSVQPVVTKATGTMAGVARLFTSVNGVNYIATGDTLALTNVTTNTTIWYLQKPVRYYRITVGGATTVTATCTAKLQPGGNQ